MRELFARTLVLALAVLLGGCWAHSYPISERFLAPADLDPAAARRAELFVDMNGTFYPDGWRSYADGRKLKAESLLNEAVRKPGLDALIAREEARQLADIEAFARGKKRIFVLIHGFNSEIDDSEPPFDTIEAQLDLGPDDGVIRFNWDGLTGKLLGAGKIWFRATATSQLAGSRGLRRVLARIEGKQIYLISHSRGASVILSALGNPVYHPSFARKAREVAAGWHGDYSTLLTPPPLPDRHNRIHALMLAPAIGRIDFCDQSQQSAIDHKQPCGKLRDLGPQLASLRYTVNRGDPVLDKFIGLSGRLNPTDFGLKAEVGEAIRTEGGYCGMLGYVFREAKPFHAFRRYARHEAFTAMLQDEGILKPGVFHPFKLVPPPGWKPCPAR
ncbi:MAG TPA: alpha/beta hydrolase [Sphingomonas sp.]|nr:alpha/beta hydrolase [Sphingomonas sp.]